jgi:predicted transcriptional regulator
MKTLTLEIDNSVYAWLEKLSAVKNRDEPTLAVEMLTQFVEQEKQRQKGISERILEDALHLIKRAEETIGDEKYNSAYLEAYRWKLKELWDCEVGNHQFEEIVALLLDVLRMNKVFSISRQQIAALAEATKLLQRPILTDKDIEIALSALEDAGLRTFPSPSDEVLTRLSDQEGK